MLTSMMVMLENTEVKFCYITDWLQQNDCLEKMMFHVVLYHQ